MKRHAPITTSPARSSTSWRLAGNATLRLPRRRSPTLVRVLRGTVLITREGDREDHVLGSGDELVLPRRGVAVAWAFTDAALSTRDAVAAEREGRLQGSERSA